METEKYFKPKNETRILDNECKYTISPILEKINKNLLKLKLNNKIITKTEEHKLSMRQSWERRRQLLQESNDQTINT